MEKNLHQVDRIPRIVNRESFIIGKSSLILLDGAY